MDPTHNLRRNLELLDLAEADKRYLVESRQLEEVNHAVEQVAAPILGLWAPVFLGSARAGTRTGTRSESRLQSSKGTRMKAYQKPSIVTRTASEIIELLGPLSCGSMKLQAQHG